MKILYIGPYRQADGWGQASRNFLLSLKTTENEIAARPIYMGTSIEKDIPIQICSMELVDIRHYDVVIQNVLPHLLDYNGRFNKNIATFFSETINLRHSTWPARLNLMDEVWVSSAVEKNNLIDSGVTKPIKIIPIGADMSRFERSYKRLPLPEGKFIFYFIGEHIQRKNIRALLIAFHTEFCNNEPVDLLLKVNKIGMPDSYLAHILEQEISELKAALRVYKNSQDYRQELLITKSMSDEEICSLHGTCDCFVSASRGEAWSLPAFDAMAFGKTPIVTANTGMEQFVNNDTGWLVKSYKQPVCVNDAPLADLYTGREFWMEPDILELRQYMREAYENSELRIKKSSAGRSLAYDFAFKTIGQKMVEAL